jgi:hypothetical protein
MSDKAMLPNKKAETAQTSDSKRDEWSVEQLSEESSNQMPDEILRQVLRGDESKGDADSRDILGSSQTVDTPQGREQAKIKDKKP